MVGQRLTSLIGRALFSKIGLAGLLLGAAYLGYANRELITRAEHGMTRRTVPLAEGFFPDPAGLAIDIPINADGRQEAYLVHAPSGKRQPIHADLLPDTPSLLEALVRRSEHATPAEARDLLDLTMTYQRALLERIHHD